MFRVLIFGGTTEGRKLAEFCAENGIWATVSVTTEYGADLLVRSEFLKAVVGKLDECQMVELLENENGPEQYALVIDATHPYAVEATRNIRRACERAGVAYERVVRGGVENDFGIYFDDLRDLIDYVNQEIDGCILVTTGSKELGRLCGIQGFSERCVIRFLPNEEMEEACLRLGYRKEQMVMEQGPFSIEQNCAHMRQFSVKYLITKDSGTSGGFEDKLEAARRCGVLPLILRRPVEQGVTLDEIEEKLISRYLRK